MQGRAADRGGQPLGRFEKLESVRGGRRIENDEVVGAVTAKLEKRERGRVLLRPGEIRGDVAIKRVRENPRTQRRIRHLFFYKMRKSDARIHAHGGK